jgi:Tol biopolymer transport system component
MKKTKAILILVIVASLGLIVPGRGAFPQQTVGELFEKALYVEESQGDLQKAIGLYQDIVKRFPESREAAAKAQLHIGLCYEKLGLKEAEKAFQKVVNDFSDQAETVKLAREKLSAMVRAKAVLDTSEKVLSVRLIWSGPEAASASYLSPDGRSLSYVDEESGNLCIRDVASGKRTIVVRKAQLDKPYQFPLISRWSPDGKSLVYAWFNMDNSIELRTIGADGSSPRTLYSQKNEMAFPAAWSPEGKFIAAVVMRDFYKSFNVGLISVEDGSLKILKTPKLLKTAPMSMVFSRDGRYLLVDLPQTDGDPKHDIFALSVDGAGESRVVEHPENDTVLGWIPGSDALLFLSSRTGTYDAWTIEIADGHAHGQPRLVRKNLGLVVPLGISPEGSLYYSVGITMSEIFTASVDLDKGTVIEPPRIIPQPLVGADEQPQWSPDGKFLAFFSKEKTAPGTRDRMILKIRSEDAGETREVKTSLEWLARSSWAPDGRSLFVIGSDGKASLAIFQIDVRTGQATLIVDSEPGANIKFIAPARDGHSVYYTCFEFGKKRARVMGIDLATRETRELYRQDAPPDIGGLSVSPDGKALFFGTLAPDDSHVLKTIPLPEGGTPREIIRSKAGAFGVSIDIHGGYCWAPDGKRILFFKEVSADKKDEKCELSVVPVEGGPVQGLGLIVDGSPDVISLHPDGRHLAYSVSRSAAEVWVMENFLPPGKK